MSGGSYDYVCWKIDEAAAEVRRRHPDSALHLAFADHLTLVAKAMHDVEWVDSCDYGPGDDHKAIRAVLSPKAEVAAITARARVVAKELSAAIKRAEGGSR